MKGVHESQGWEMSLPLSLNGCKHPPRTELSARRNPGYRWFIRFGWMIVIIHDETRTQFCPGRVKLCGYVVDSLWEMLEVLKLHHGLDAAVDDSSWMAVDI